MDLEDLAPKRTAAIPIGQEDLSRLSISDLEERIELLSAEIERCRDAKTAKESQRESADRFFKI